MKHKNILISGASSGIGAELVRNYAAQGNTLGLIALEGDDLTHIHTQANQLGAKQVYVYAVNVTDRTAARAAVADFSKKAGSIDLWIASAGIDVDVPLKTFDDNAAQKIEALYDVNVNGLIYTTNAVLEHMLKQQKSGLLNKLRPKGTGHIVGMASLAGKKIYPVHADYSATKAAVDAYLESLRVRLLGKSITVTTVSPGFVQTPMTAGHTHPMPFRVSAESAAHTIMQGIAQKKEHIAFPKALAVATQIVRWLPSPVWKLVAKASARL